MTHPTRLENTTIIETAREIGNLRYDALYYFLICLSIDMGAQAKADRDKGRNKLADDGYELAFQIQEAANVAQQMYHSYKDKM